MRVLTVLVTAMLVTTTLQADLKEIKKSGVLRHLGVPYANFVTNAGDGMEVEIIQLFAKHIGVKYEHVMSTWGEVIPDLIGQKVQPDGDHVKLLEKVPVKGDVIANGLTILNWRKKILDYSDTTFPTQIWLLAKGSDNSLTPIKPTGDMNKDIEQVKAQLKNITVTGIFNTCLDPKSYGIDKVAKKIETYDGDINEMADFLIKGKAQTIIFEVPDTLVALTKWPGEIKIVGPLSQEQGMAAGFRKDCPKLRAEFGKFYKKIQQDGTYLGLVKKYYPSVVHYFPKFFANMK